jgi:NADH-quinone oxidoreductase subunit E
VRRRLGLKNKEVSPDGLFSIEEVECMGACAWAPAIQVNYDFYHHMTPEKFDALLEKLKNGAGPDAEPRPDGRALSGPAA